MSLKTASLLAFVGMLVLTVLMLADLLHVILGVLHDVIPANAVLRSLVYSFASVTVTVFLWVFHRFANHLRP